VSRRARRPKAPARPPVPPPAQRRDFDRALWLFAAAIVPLILLAYQPAWHGGFVWDDDGHVTKAALRTVSGLWRIWFEPGATQQYYPVVHSAFWLHRRGLATTGYHLVNILLHAASACSARGDSPPAGRRRQAFWRPRSRAASRAGRVGGLGDELKNTLSGVFYFGAALLYLHFDERRTRGLYLAALGVFALALLSKSVTSTLPFGLLVAIWWLRGRIDWRRDVRPLLPFVAMGVAAGVMTVWMERVFIGAEARRLRSHRSNAR
jgi:hypothetical protein